MRSSAQAWSPGRSTEAGDRPVRPGMSGRSGRPVTSDGSRSAEGSAGADGVDVGAWHGRAAVAQVIMSGFGLASALAAHDDTRAAALLAGAGVAATLALWLLLRRRPAVRLLLLWAALYLLLTVIGSLVIPDGSRLTLSFTVMAFLFAGLTQPPGTSLVLLPPALAVQWMVIDLPAPQAAIRMTIAAFVWLTVTELTARLTSQLRSTRNQLAREAVTDALTGLTNRRGWTTTLSSLLARSRADGRPLALLLADLDHFKAYNDAHGHLAGDELLRAFSARIPALLPAGAVAARWGGEEFAVALPGAGPGVAAEVAETIRGSVPHGQSCSVGLTYARPEDDERTLLARVDGALYAAKAAGRDRVHAA